MQCVAWYRSRDSSVGIATRYWLERLGIESRWGRGPRLSRVKAAGTWRWPPNPSSAEVKESVELYLYSPSGPSWSVLGWTLPLPLAWRASGSKHCLHWYNQYISDTISTYLIQSVHIWYNQYISDTISTYLIQSVHIWYNQCISDTISTYLIQSVHIWCNQYISDTINTYLIQSVYIWYNHYISDTISTYLIQSVHIWYYS